jgi:hypothetical protein
MQTSTRKRLEHTVKTCFIAAPTGTDLSTLQGLLADRGIEPKTVTELPLNTLPFTENLVSTIAASDLLIAIFDGLSQNSNVYFELGCACGNGKDVLIITPNTETLPFDLKELLVIRASFNDQDAIGFALDQYLRKPKKTKKVRQVQPIQTRAIGAVADDLLNDLSSKELSPLELERIVERALKASGVSTVSQARERDWYADFAVWSDELQSSVSNPLLIEVKRNLDVRAVDRMLEISSPQASRYLLLLFLNTVPTVKERLAQTPNILAMPLRQFLQALRDRSFGQTVKSLRDDKIHGRDRLWQD